ncbi:SIMPL domain-containing protein [Haliea atlantica]
MNTFFQGTLAALLVGLGLVFSGWGIGEGLQQFRTGDRSVTIKGLAERSVDSDYATWSLTFRRAGDDFGDVQRSLAADRERVANFLQSSGFSEQEVEVRPLQVQDVFAREYAPGNHPFRYTGSGQVIVKSPRVALVETAALAVDPLVEAGIELEGGSGPRYQLRGFNDIKPALLADATRNARQQAIDFAAEAGAELGALKEANQGVIRITGDDGSDWDDGSSRTKRLRVVSTFIYALR